MTESIEKEQSQKDLAAENWARYEYGISRGHREYTETARMLEGFYMGGGYDKDGILQPGGHWNDADLDILQSERRPAYEFNQVKPAIDAALGYQIANRMDISFRPRSGDADKEKAEVRSKLAMQIAGNNNLQWCETDVFSDGIIQQRGYYDCRINTDDSIEGELDITVEDPMDIIPDPDSKSYDPAEWGDVIKTKWMTLDDIEGIYGKEARDKAEENSGKKYLQNEEFGMVGDGAERNKFGSKNTFDSSFKDQRMIRLRIIDRQHYVRELMTVSISPSGDSRPVEDNLSEEMMAGMQANGFSIAKKVVKRVRWTVSTVDTLLFDEWSPYDRFTIVPYFPFFRRGRTRGMIDNAVGPQKAMNKGVSQAIHIINTTANSGWQVEQGQLTNMSTNDLESFGASTGLVLERRPNTQPLQKIQPNNMPNGLAEIIQMSNKIIQDVTVPDAMRGLSGAGESGIAIQSKQHASQQILAVPLDNLARTRNLLARWIDYAISKYYTNERIIRIIKADPVTGKENIEELVINQQDPATGAYLNDMTSGEYDVVITEQPMQVTFENSQFEQIMEMRQAGINVPDFMVIKHSNISDKHEIIDTMQAMMAPPQAPPDPTIEAKVALINAQTEKTKAETVNKSVEGMYSATQAAQQLVMVPSIAPTADAMLKSAGFVDQDQGSIIPQDVQPQEVPAPMQENTNPMTPLNPAVGMEQGIEGGEQPQIQGEMFNG